MKWNDFGIPNAGPGGMVYNVQDQLLIGELTRSDPSAGGGDNGSGIALGCDSISHESYKALLIRCTQNINRTKLLSESTTTHVAFVALFRVM